MNIKVIILIVCGLLVGGGLITSWYLLSHYSNRVALAPTPQVLPTETSAPVGTELYEDPSGFSFEYPSDVTVEAVEDDAEYASIRLTSDELDGAIALQADATTADSADEWIEQQQIDTTGADVASVSLADVEAVQIASAGGILTVAYDQGALFTIYVDWTGEQDFWQNVYDMMLSSFAFVLPEEDAAPVSASGGGSASGGIIFEGEEIIE